jgi:alanyl-tRNA synthetase
VKWGEYGFEEAKAKGAMALFGEKYGDRVRMVTVGDEESNDIYSRELCGGTHVQATGEIGLFVVASESAIAAGIRRIEALTGEGALAYLRKRERQVEEMALTAKLPAEEISGKFNDLLEENKKLRKELEKIEAQNAASQILELFQEKGTEVNGTRVLVDSLTSKEVIKVYEERIRSESAVLLGAFINEEGHYAIISSQQSVKSGVKPQELSKAINEEFEGRGGGRPTITQGSLQKPIDMTTFRDFILTQLKESVK